VQKAGDTHIHIQAMDSDSFHSFMQKNHQAVGDAYVKNLHSGGGSSLETTRSALGLQ
jgi:hypothetical protein